MTNEPKTINKYKQAKLNDRHDMERNECSEDDNSGCPYYSDGDKESVKKQSKKNDCKNCKK